MNWRGAVLENWRGAVMENWCGAVMEKSPLSVNDGCLVPRILCSHPSYSTNMLTSTVRPRGTTHTAETFEVSIDSEHFLILEPALSNNRLCHLD